MVDSVSVQVDAKRCRSCRALLQVLIIDLGQQPVADALLDASHLGQPERLLPLRVFVCDQCGLAQLPAADDDIDDSSGWHGHGAAFSSTVSGHVQDWADSLFNQFPIGSGAVLDVASGDGALLWPFFERGVRVLGLEANARIAATAKVPTQRGCFGLNVANELVAVHGQFDLVLVNHALAHAADLNDFLDGLAHVLRPGGTIAIEFHHALSLVRGQFDVACHAHRSYFSLHALEIAMARHGLAIVDAEQIDLHGGSVRATAAHGAEPRAQRPRVDEVRTRERICGLDSAAGYRDVTARADQVRAGLLAFLHQASAAGARVVAYGAPSRGITLLNYCAITPGQIAFTVDRSPAKQGHFLPGCRLPVLSPSAILAARPDFVLILPWALSEEIVDQMASVREWGGRFVVAVPELCILD